MPEAYTLTPVVAFLHFQYALIPYGPGAAWQTPQIYQHHEVFALLYDPERSLYSDFSSACRANIPRHNLAMDHLWLTKNVEAFCR